RPNCAMVTTPQANCPIAMIPFATTGRRFGRYLNEMWIQGRPKTVASDLYSKPHPSQCSLAGYGVPQLGHMGANSDTWCLHSLQGFTWFLSPAAAAIRRRAYPAVLAG